VVGSSQSRDLSGGIGKAGAERERKRKAGPFYTWEKVRKLIRPLLRGSDRIGGRSCGGEGEKPVSEWLPAVALPRLGLE
jgi:hypothetical protein